MQYYEDFEVGDTYSTGRRTIAESDILNFVELCGLFEPNFIDEEHIVAHTPYERRFAPGEMTMSFALGNVIRTGLVDASIAMLEITAEFHNPVFAGDTIGVEVEIIDKNPTSDDEQGIIVFENLVSNQDQELVVTMKETALMKRKP